MRILTLTALAALAACSSGDETASGETSAEDVAEQMRDAMEEGVVMTPGEYETQVEIVEVDIPGLPPEIADQVGTSMSMPYRGCLTEADLEQPDESFFTGENNDCTYENFDMSGGKLEATMTCSAEGSTQRMEMSGAYRDDGYDMDMTMSSTEPESRMRWKISANRVGDCSE